MQSCCARGKRKQREKARRAKQEATKLFAGVWKDRQPSTREKTERLAGEDLIYLLQVDVDFRRRCCS